MAAHFGNFKFRVFMLNTFKQLNDENLLQLKRISQRRNILPKEFPIDEDDVTEEEEDPEKTARRCCEFLEKEQYVKPNDVEVLKLLLTHVRRPDLLQNIRDYVSETSEIKLPLIGRNDQVFNNQQNDININNVRNVHQLAVYLYEVANSNEFQTYWILLLMFCSLCFLFLLVDYKFGFYETLMVIVGNTILRICCGMLATTIYYYHNDFKDCYRYIQCTRGCICGSLLFFNFNTTDYQKAVVVNCNEFSFELLQKRHPYLLPHPDKRMHYFLNTNRYINGGIRPVGSLLDNKKAVRGAEVFAMSDAVDSVWYFHGQWKAWLKYETANNIRWICTK